MGKFKRWLINYLDRHNACEKCKERGKPWHGSDPVCAFGSAEFTDNWACATLFELREALLQPSPMTNRVVFEDQSSAIVHLPLMYLPDEHAVSLWLTWYKRRGRTEQAWILSDDKDPRRPTEQECLAITDAIRTSYADKV